jgi:hypothetical protein
MKDLKLKKEKIYIEKEIELLDGSVMTKISDL